MDRLLMVLAVGLIGVVYGQGNVGDPCLPCNQDICDMPTMCTAGMTKDRCGCCDVCAKREGDLCDHASVQTKQYSGPCGENLECAIREDVGKRRDQEAVCQCKMNDYLCGSDGHTYPNFCRLVTAAVESKTKITIEHKGACKSAPYIVSEPEHRRNLTGDGVVLACEVKGYPIPTVQWSWKRGEGDKLVHLPSDDEHISVNSRGGPEKYEVTGWVQIIDVQKWHQGDYTCRAENELGTAESTARVSVYERGDERY